MPSRHLQDLRQDHLGRLRQHVYQVMCVVPARDRCPGRAAEQSPGGGSFLRRLLGRG